MGVLDNGRARSRFQSGLLAWLRAPDDPAGLREMIAVLRELTAAETQASGRVLWRSAETVLATVLDSTLPVDDEVLQICRRIERHLTALAKGQSADDGELRDALFGFASRRRQPPAPLAQSPAGALAALGGALGRTAELLPLIVGGVSAKHAAETIAAWSAAAARLDVAWHALFGSNGEAAATEFRAAATALVAAALTLDDAGCLRLAEALASTGALTEERAAREQPGLRAAVAAALETVCERDGPNHRHFDQRAFKAASRLEAVLAGQAAKGRSPGAEHELKLYLGDARETIEELRLALYALPPDLVGLRQGADWFAGHGGPGNTIALRGLAVLLGEVLTQTGHEDVDDADGQHRLGAAIDALAAAIGQIADGQPPLADEAAFAGLRELAARRAVTKKQPPVAAMPPDDRHGHIAAGKTSEKSLD